MKHTYMTRIYFSKSYLKPHTENYIDVINTGLDKKSLTAALNYYEFRYREE